VGSRPVSRVLSRTIIHLGYTSPCNSSDLPGSRAGHASAPLFGLAPGGVYPATPVASRAVRSYRTISPLPALPVGSHRRYLFCGTFRRLTPPRHYLAPCPVEPGLSSTHSAAIVRPTSRLGGYHRTLLSGLVGLCGLRIDLIGGSAGQLSSNAGSRFRPQPLLTQHSKHDLDRRQAGLNRGRCRRAPD